MYMHRKQEKIRRRNLRDAEREHDRRCRDLIAAIRKMNTPITYAGIRRQLLMGPNEEWYGGAFHEVEAHALLYGTVSACIAGGLLKVRERKQLAVFNAPVEFELALPAYRVKTKVAKNQPPEGGPVTITVSVKEHGLEIRFAEQRVVITGKQALLLEALHLGNGDTITHRVAKRRSAEALRTAVRLLKAELRNKLELDPDVVNRGIRNARGQGYWLDRSVIRLRWLDEPGRQRGVSSYQLA